MRRDLLLGVGEAAANWFTSDKVRHYYHVRRNDERQTNGPSTLATKNGRLPLDIKLAQSDSEILSAYPVMKHLRDRESAASFLELVKRQQSSGYHLAALSDERETRAVAGFRFGDNFAWGRHVYVDDPVTDPDARSKGYGAAILAWLAGFARSKGAGQLHLDSGTERTDTHRFYHREGLEVSSLHFKRVL